MTMNNHWDRVIRKPCPGSGPPAGRAAGLGQSLRFLTQDQLCMGPHPPLFQDLLWSSPSSLLRAFLNQLQTWLSWVPPASHAPQTMFTTSSLSPTSEFPAPPYLSFQAQFMPRFPQKLGCEATYTGPPNFLMLSVIC